MGAELEEDGQDRLRPGGADVHEVLLHVIRDAVDVVLGRIVIVELGEVVGHPAEIEGVGRRGGELDLDLGAVVDDLLGDGIGVIDAEHLAEVDRRAGEIDGRLEGEIARRRDCIPEGRAYWSIGRVAVARPVIEIARAEPGREGRRAPWRRTSGRPERAPWV